MQSSRIFVAYWASKILFIIIFLIKFLPWYSDQIYHNCTRYVFTLYSPLLINFMKFIMSWRYISFDSFTLHWLRYTVLQHRIINSLTVLLGSLSVVTQCGEMWRLQGILAPSRIWTCNLQIQRPWDMTDLHFVLNLYDDILFQDVMTWSCT